MSLKATLVEKLIPNAKVITSEVSQPLKQVLSLMSEEHIGAVCILESGKVAGIFTERDFLKLGQQFSEDLMNKPISEFMTADPVTISEKSNLYECIIQMKLGYFRHLVMVNDKNEPVRMISIRDAFQYLVDELES